MAKQPPFAELFDVLFQAVKQAETELCSAKAEGAREARRILSEALDRCYEALREQE